MKQMAVSTFKATCLAVMEDVRRTGRPVLITKRGVPIAQVGPPVAEKGASRRLGALRGTAKIVGDIVSPVAAPEEWEVLRRR